MNYFSSLAQSVKLVIALGVLLGYALQFFVAIQIMLPSIKKSCNLTKKHPMIGELLFRTFMVLLTFAVAELVPNLNLLLSLIGALCSTALALVFPPIIQIVLSFSENGSKCTNLCKNLTIIIFAMIGLAAGTYESIRLIILETNWISIIKSVV